MNCNEVGRRQLPVLSSGYPYITQNANAWVCTGIVIEDSVSCVCIYEKNIRNTERYESYVAYEVTYQCIRKIQCREETEVIVKDIETKRVKDRIKHLYIPTGVIRTVLGTTTAAFGGCSCALEGVGAIRTSL